MARYDVFNGDADGICALHQLRLAEPAESTLVTGVKREIDLLRRVEAGEGDEVTVLDVSLDKNRDDLVRLLAAGARVRYFDHHFAGEIPDHPALEAHIDTAPEVCSSLLVDASLGGRFRPWAVVAAFGDNLHAAATRAAEPLGLDDKQLTLLAELGTCLNYNGYGSKLEDLFFAPDALYRSVSGYADPFDFVANEPAYATLRAGYQADMAETEALKPEVESAGGAVFLLPDAPWSRRVAGVFGNDLARRFPARAHALLSVMPDGSYRVSVRAPSNNKTGADELCRRFPTGGGRQAAAGINALPQEEFGQFIDAFADHYPGTAA